MITVPGKIARAGGKTVIVPELAIDREITRQEIQMVEIRLFDGREISPEQRRKIFAIIGDIAWYSGHEPEYLRKLLTLEFVKDKGCEFFSLSNCEKSTATDFISWLIDFCFRWCVPTEDTLLMQADDIGKYLYSCLEHRKCAVCNAPADLHHVEAVGMGRDRGQIIHEGMQAMALCRKHHIEAHAMGQKSFDEKYHIYGIRLDAYLCGRLNLKEENK